MNTTSIFIAISISLFSIISAHPAGCEELKKIELPAPRTTGGMPLMQALELRKSSREFSSKKLPMEVLSDLLWAARGINRRSTEHLTAPTAKNMQEIDVYVVLNDGVYLYDAKTNTLMPIVSGNIQASTGQQPFVTDAPVNLVFVADYAKMKSVTRENADLYSATDTGYISQNVYLYCASEGLATVVRGSLDRAKLAKAMKLRKDQKIILAQTVGYPK